VRFSEGVHSLEDLRPGMRLQGVVTNVTAFGAFVDVGVHQDGLVHISQLADRFVRNPAEVVRVQQPVEVTVLEVDAPRKRISLSMRKNAAPTLGEPGSPPARASH
jgi:protein Tex